MKLTNAERAWIEKRKKGMVTKTNSPSYAEFGAPPDEPFKERLKKAKSYPAFSKERLEAEEKHYKKYGRAWWIFHDTKTLRLGSNYKNWILQYKKGGEQRGTYDIQKSKR